MPEISDDELAEYHHLKGIYTRGLIQKSLNSVTRLEDDIDTPIKKCVMAFALLGCQPIWSCCGFDYVGQSIHKSHQHGRCYFILANNPRTMWIVDDILFGRGFGGNEFWNISQKSQTMVDLHTDFSNIISQWDDRDSLHYSEQAVQHIQHLEEYLLSLQYQFEESAIIKDTNHPYHDRFQFWQYPPKEDWVIAKEDLLK